MIGFTRREFIRTAGGFVSAATLGAAPRDAQAQEGRRFNILFLMTDQHNPSVMGCSGNPIVKTPTMDKLAADGVRFTNALCSTPFCTPTRASLVTGLWPHTHGLVRNVQAGEKGLMDDAVTTEQILFDKKYETFHMGKWHLGPTTDLRCYRKETEILSKKAYRQFLKDNIKGKRHEPREGEVKIGEVAYLPEMAKFHNVWKDEKQRSRQDLSIIGRFLRPPELNYESWLAGRCIDL
ncbi:MAG: sulfatase-like hydrolase/transferase, partial [Planctomycetes bacterium]|nr:sulfatase-like hydrolase/transferase [Planctomycetota bacterium]